MRVLLALSRWTGLAVRRTARSIANGALTVPYVLGFVAAAVLGTALAIATAARLGWADARRKGRHGAA